MKTLLKRLKNAKVLEHLNLTQKQSIDLYNYLYENKNIDLLIKLTDLYEQYGLRYILPKRPILSLINN